MFNPKPFCRAQPNREALGISAPGHNRIDGAADCDRSPRGTLATAMYRRRETRVTEVAPEVWTDEARGTRALVYFNDDADGELQSTAEVRRFVDALTEPIRLAFRDPTEATT